jgi:hypothetical protein
VRIDLEELIIQLNKENINVSFFSDTGIELTHSHGETIGVCKSNSLEKSLAILISDLSNYKTQKLTNSQLSLL